MSAYTPGPWAIGTTIMNDGAIIIMGETRIGMVDAQTYYERGQGHNAECPERDANARLIAAAPFMYALAEAVADYFADTDAPLGKLARTVLAKVGAS